MRQLPVKRITVYHLALKLKRTVSHATARRAVSEPIIVAVELMNGAVGYGETLPRAYVTGEDNESAIRHLAGEFPSQVINMRPASFFEALDAIDALPFVAADGTGCPAARACMELALLDAYSRGFDRSIDQIAGWMDLVGFGPPGSARRVRYSGVLASESIDSLRKNLRLMYWYGLRHFKLKVGFADDDGRVALAAGILGRAIRKDRATLRLDANGVWSLEQAVERLRRWADVPIAGVEQPLSPADDHLLPELCERTQSRIFHDESLVTLDDADRLHQLGVADGFNIRISKCGGLLPALRIAAFAAQRGIRIQLGCMVGESSILTAAGVRFLGSAPRVEFVEGAFGRLLMAEDVARRSLTFRLGGRLPRIDSAGLGCRVDPELLERHSIDPPKVIEL